MLSSAIDHGSVEKVPGGYETGHLGVLSPDTLSSATSKRIGQLAEEMKELSRRDMEISEKQYAMAQQSQGAVVNFDGRMDAQCVEFYQSQITTDQERLTWPDRSALASAEYDPSAAPSRRATYQERQVPPSNQRYTDERTLQTYYADFKHRLGQMQMVSQQRNCSLPEATSSSVERRGTRAQSDPKRGPSRPRSLHRNRSSNSLSSRNKAQGSSGARARSSGARDPTPTRRKVTTNLHGRQADARSLERFKRQHMVRK